MRRPWSWCLVVVVMLAVGARARAGDDPPTLVDWLKAHGQDASYAARERLFAERFPSDAYSGSAEQNLALWRALKGEAASGGSPRPAGGDARPAGRPGVTPGGRRDGGPSAQSHEFAFADAWTVRVDPSEQVVEVDAPLPTRWETGPAAQHVEEAPISPTLPVGSSFVSAAMLCQKAKAFDDGIYAAVELAAQEGAGSFAGKRAMLAALRERLSRLTPSEAGPGTAVLFAAAKAAGDDVAVPGSLQSLVDTQLSVFDAAPDASKPIGFYTWSTALRSIFRQDRVLQAPLPSGPHRDLLVRALHDDPQARATYVAYTGLVERLTNPFSLPDLRPLLDRVDHAGAAASPSGASLDDAPAFVPFCRSHETDMTKALLALGVKPDNIDVMGEFVKAVKAGRIALAVRPDSGWYDRTQWALEPLLLPEKAAESRRLALTPAYRARLEELFRGAIALARETHVKSLEQAYTTSMATPRRVSVSIRPEITVEPLATAWLRRADTYRYVRGLLEATFGRKGLATMRRQTPDGPVATPLDAELRAFEALFTGAFVRACREIGHPVGALPGADAADAFFVEWARGLAGDADLTRDLRMMVPVMVDPAQGRAKVWVFLGWASQDLQFRFARTPSVTVVSTKDGHAATSDEVSIDFAGNAAMAAYPVFAEVWTKHLLDRDEFRRLCDEKKTKAAILAAVESR